MWRDAALLEGEYVVSAFRRTVTVRLKPDTTYEHVSVFRREDRA